MLTDDHWLSELNLNLLATVRLDRLLIPQMIERGAGAVVHVTSIQSVLPLPDATTAYAAAKAALRTYSKSISKELGPKGVRVNAVSPGPVVTGGTEEMLGDYIGMLGRGTIRGRAADPDEIASVVAFLAGPGSSYINGSIVLADGGAVSAMPS